MRRTCQIPLKHAAGVIVENTLNIASSDQDTHVHDLWSEVVVTTRVPPELEVKVS